MSEIGTLRIYTRIGSVGEEKTGVGNQKQRARRLRARPGTRFGNRLLRNSAIACAVLLGILALGNVRQPWAEKAAEGIEKALSMRIDLDDSIGELTFVKRIMPESALVFLNVNGAAGMAQPTGTEPTHPWSSLQPWLMYDGENSPVYAVDAGVVTAVSPLSGGYGILVDHGNGLESLYAGLGEVAAQAGDSVKRGQRLGACDGGLYFELRQDGASVDPSERLGL